MQLALWGVLVFAVVGLIFGVALAATARKFYVPTNPLVDEVRNNLPSANCGACGYAGCGAYAEAVVEERLVSPNLCTPGGKDIAEKIASLTGKVAGDVMAGVAIVRCHGTFENAVLQAEYVGIRTCAAANLVFGGPKACKNGCIGFGDCERICPFNAIHVEKDGIAHVDEEKCTGCGKCIAICPKNTIELVPRDYRVVITCFGSGDKMPVVRARCSVGCISCRRCVKACPAGAVSWDGTRIVIDHHACIAYGPSCHEACVAACPTFILHRKDQQPQPEPKKEAKNETSRRNEGDGRQKDERV